MSAIDKGCFPHAGEVPPVLLLEYVTKVCWKEYSTHGRLAAGGDGCVLRQPAGSAELSIESPFVPANGFQTDEERLCDSGVLTTLRRRFENASLLGRQPVLRFEERSPE